MHGLVDVAVARAHNLRKLDADEADQQASGRRLEILGPRWQLAQPRTQVGNVLDEGERSEAADHAQAGVSAQLAGMFQVIRRNAKQRFIAQKPALDHRTGDRRQHDRAQNAGGPAADDFLDDEQHRGDGSVKGGSQSGSCAYGSDEPQLLARQLQPPAQRRGNACADLQ